VVLQTQAGLNDTQKMVTELFDSKINGFAATPLRYWAKPGALPSLLSQEDFVNLAAYGVAVGGRVGALPACLYLRPSWMCN
jgi:hypothetical protein